VQALRAACDSVGMRPRRAALVIPDLTAKVSLLKFEKAPSRRDDLDQMIRWQMKKSTPFPIEDAAVTHSTGVRAAAGNEILLVAAKRHTTREYEGVCDEVGVEAGLIDLSTLAVVNLSLASNPPSGDWLIAPMRTGAQ